MLTSLEYHPRCATAIWYRTQMIWPPENDDDKHMIADRPEDWDKVDGDGLVGENEESSVEDAQGDVHENVETEDR
jgi:hypothetical protein